MKTAGKAARVHKSEGNVFADLGLADPEGRLAKAQLAHQICQIITARKLTQLKAAQLLGLDQPKISALVHGRLRGFSVERLFRCLNDLGREVEVIVRPAPKRAGRGRILVIAAAG
jgi:predicted XRE-type DNA-binding protein